MVWLHWSPTGFYLLNWPISFSLNAVARLAVVIAAGLRGLEIFQRTWLCVYRWISTNNSWGAEGKVCWKGWQVTPWVLSQESFASFLWSDISVIEGCGPPGWVLKEWKRSKGRLASPKIRKHRGIPSSAFFLLLGDLVAPFPRHTWAIPGGDLKL